MTSVLFRIGRTWRSLLKRNYLKKEKLFSYFFVSFLESSSNFKHIQKKKIVIANVFNKLQTLKDLIRALSKKGRFRTSCESQHVKGSQRVLKSSSEHFHQNFPLLWEEMICRIPPLLKHEILGVFLNRLTAEDKYPLPDCENLLFPIQRQSS